MNSEDKQIFGDCVNKIGEEIGKIGSIIDPNDPLMVDLSKALVRLAHDKSPTMMTLIAMSRIEED